MLNRPGTTVSYIVSYFYNERTVEHFESCWLRHDSLVARQGFGTLASYHVVIPTANTTLSNAVLKSQDSFVECNNPGTSAAASRICTEDLCIGWNILSETPRFTSTEGKNCQGRSRCVFDECRPLFSRCTLLPWCRRFRRYLKLTSFIFSLVVGHMVPSNDTKATTSGFRRGGW